MGSYHLRGLRAHPRGTRRPKVPADPSLRAALAGVQADFACIATPAGTLAETANEALAAGLAVLVEKPMATDEDSARALAADAEHRGLLLAVGLVERCNPAVSALRMMLEE